MVHRSFNSFLLIATVALFVCIFTVPNTNGAAINNDSQSVENDTSTSAESNEVPVIPPRLARAVSIESASAESNSTESDESSETGGPIVALPPQGCTVTPSPDNIPTEFACASWNGGRQGAPFAKQCDCDWAPYYDCLCIAKSGWATCLKGCNQVSKNQAVNSARHR